MNHETDIQTISKAGLKHSLELKRISPFVPRCVRSYLKNRADAISNEIGNGCVDMQHVIVALVAKEDRAMLELLKNNPFYKKMFERLGIIPSEK